MADQPEAKAEEKTASSAQNEAAQAPADVKAEAGSGGQTTGKGQRGSVVLAEGLGGVLGVKAGMTQIYEEGRAVAVTVIDLGHPSVVTQVKTQENDGYQAVQVGFIEKKPKAANKAAQGHAKKAGAPGFYCQKEFRVPAGAKLEGVEVGKTLSAEFVKPGDWVDLTSVSKGKGFQGVMKRHHFAGGMATHGASIVHRMPGSISGDRGTGRIPKGKPMAGHMGHRQVTIQNVRVVRVDVENGLLLVHGSVPGPKTGIVTVRRAVKKAQAQA